MIPLSGKVYDTHTDEWVGEMSEYGYCALCGDGGWPKGSECRRVRAAKAAGTFSPKYDTVTGERLDVLR